MVPRCYYVSINMQTSCEKALKLSDASLRNHKQAEGQEMERHSNRGAVAGGGQGGHDPQVFRNRLQFQ